ncbi:MAG: hypothetical protein J3K34DRAFT_460202 [Monoraphidium minutum]|nr:MAG: hypothetical protein J3K34DRAFT_460202 [Monoraphidium minutum]
MSTYRQQQRPQSQGHGGGAGSSRPSSGVGVGGRRTLDQEGFAAAASAAAQAAAPDSGGGGAGAGAAPAAPRVLFSCCKGETHTHRSGFKQLFRRLRSAYRPEKLDCADDLHPEVLLGAAGGGAGGPAVLVFGCPTQRFSAPECDALAGLVRGGGGLLVLLGEGGEAGAGTNLNFVLEQFGIAANADAVLRTSHHKYMHPKEALVVDGLLNRGLLAGGGGGGSGGGKAAVLAAQRERQLLEAGAPAGGGGLLAGALEFVYPHGCSLTVQSPAVPLLSSGRICYPTQRPLAAAWEAPPGSGGGRLLVVGSARLFDDRWLDKEANARLMDWAFKWLRPGSRLALHPGDAAEPDIADARLLPDTEALADRPKPCLQEVRALPRDWARLFDGGLAGVGFDLLPDAVGLYAALGLRKAPLGLIAPGFEAPLPPLKGAAFPPAARGPPPPALELFDLDDAFASAQSRLAAIFNKCAGPGPDGADVEDFLLEAGCACGLDARPEEGAKGVLSELLRQVLWYRTVGTAGCGGGGDTGGGEGHGVERAASGSPRRLMSSMESRGGLCSGGGRQRQHRPAERLQRQHLRRDAAAQPAGRRRAVALVVQHRDRDAPPRAAAAPRRRRRRGRRRRRRGAAAGLQRRRRVDLDADVHLSAQLPRAAAARERAACDGVAQALAQARHDLRRREQPGRVPLGAARLLQRLCRRVGVGHHVVRRQQPRGRQPCKRAQQPAVERRALRPQQQRRQQQAAQLVALQVAVRALLAAAAAALPRQLPLQCGRERAARGGHDVGRRGPEEGQHQQQVHQLRGRHAAHAAAGAAAAAAAARRRRERAEQRRAVVLHLQRRGGDGQQRRGARRRGGVRGDGLRARGAAAACAHPVCERAEEALVIVARRAEARRQHRRHDRHLPVWQAAEPLHRRRGGLCVKGGVVVAGARQRQHERRRPGAAMHSAAARALAVLAQAEAAIAAQRQRTKLRPELNTVAVGRLGCYLPPSSPSVAILSSHEVARALTQRLRSPGPLAASDFPMELRSYTRGAHMPWHKDEQLYDDPQWECIYTVENSSDSVTQWRDDAGELLEARTDPNSLLAVLAEAWDHRVTPARAGSRAIIKFAMTSSRGRLPSFQANLDRQAYAQ